MTSKNVKIHLVIALAALTALLSGCVQQTYKPTKTSLELQSIQTKEFEAPYKVAFASVISVFQDLGYIIATADSTTGLITAASPKSQRHDFFRGQVMSNKEATAFIETMPSKLVSVRLNFVNHEESSTGYGMKGETIVPIEDPKLYQETFEKVQKAIFVRTNRS